jgi:hypothetical protein
MQITNSQIKQTAMQVFASSPGYETPFYNRERSKKEIQERFKDIESLKQSAYIISAPLGTGKTFFIDQMSSELGVQTKTKPLIVKTINQEQLKNTEENVFFVDEGDIKSSWDNLKKGIELIQSHIDRTGQTVLLIGDYCLQNPELAGIFGKKEYLNHFEPLNKEFLQGVIKQRLSRYLDIEKPEDIIEESLYKILVPDELAPVASFRSVLSFLERVVRLLPVNSKPCKITPDLAKDWVEKEYDPAIYSDKQEDFLNNLLDFISENHPGGSGLMQGLTEDNLFMMGRKAGYKSKEEFHSDIIEPFTRNEVLISKGIPYCNEKGEFIRRPEPFYPSIPLLLLSEL